MDHTDTITIRDPKQLGAIVRAVRKAQSLRQDELGRISHSFMGDLEEGKPTAQLGKVLEVLRELGVILRVELPKDMDRAQFDRYLHHPTPPERPR
jgi:transcriptional regulator with XRE-family HTH domain